MPIKATQKVQVITNGSMTGTSVINGTAQKVLSLSGCSFHLIWTGTPNGTFGVEVSNDGGTTFTAVTLSTTLSAAGAAGSHFINLDGIMADQIRCTYTNSSSTGTLNAYFVGKEQ